MYKIENINNVDTQFILSRKQDVLAKYLYKKIPAFTLVELIITITILAILATIGFINLQSYISEARDINRITSLKSIQTSLNIYKAKNQTLPFPDDYVDVVGISYQGNIGTGIINKLKLSGTFKDPKDYNYYTYSISRNKTKFQISSLLENNNKIIFSFDNNLLNQVYADNTSRYIFTLGDRIGIILDETTNIPINELLNGTGTIDLNTDSGSYTAVFTNDSTNSGTITGTGINLLNDIVVVQNSCILGSSVITSGQQINSYNTNSVAYNQTCTPIIRSCNNGVLYGDENYKYDTCSPVAALNCTATTYNGYSIPTINHNSNQNITKNITGGVADINASCINGVLTYGSENINCNSNYVLDGGICQADLCTGNAPDFSIVNGTQKYNYPWLHNATAGICTYICQAGYYYNTNLCNAASIGYIVSTQGQTNQTPCNANDKYQDNIGQTSCKTVSTGYYSTPIGNVSHTGQTQCEANNYCVGGVKYACPAGYSSPAGSSSDRACIKNTRTTGSYGSCSVSCGGGTQSRSVVCTNYLGNTIADSNCTDTKPTTSQSCNTQSCYTYSWSYGSRGSCSVTSPTLGSWGTCSKTCGGGTQARTCSTAYGNQTRTATCKRNDGVTVSNSYCGTPITSTSCSVSCSGYSTSQSCNTQSCCVSNVGNSCSTSIKIGCSYRAVACGTRTGNPAYPPVNSTTSNVSDCNNLNGVCDGYWFFTVLSRIYKSGTVQCNGSCY